MSSIFWKVARLGLSTILCMVICRTYVFYPIGNIVSSKNLATLSLAANVSERFCLSAAQACQMVCYKPKIQILVNFGGLCNKRCWYILWPFGPFSVPFGIFYGTLVHFGNLVYFSRFWYIEPRKIWQPWCSSRETKRNKVWEGFCNDLTLSRYAGVKKKCNNRNCVDALKKCTKGF
jgi:hypothetical protein